MKKIAITQSVFFIKERDESRDSLDRNWIRFLEKCNFIPILLPSNLTIVKKIIYSTEIDGFLLTGGTSLAKYNGNTPERDELERWIVHYSILNSIPLIGICRGMQVIQDYFGVMLDKLEGHVRKEQVINIKGELSKVNSYHNFGAKYNTPCLNQWAVSNDNVIKAINHKQYNIHGIMWHPERFNPFRNEDIIYFKTIFN